MCSSICSIHPSTRNMLEHLDDDVYVEVYLEGELNAGFRRFQKAIRETLEMFRVYSHNKIQCSFIDPSTALSQKARSEFMADLAAKGIQPTNVIDRRGGERVEKIIFPGAVVSYGGAEKGVMLLKGNKASSPEEEINQSIEGIEYELANALYKLTETEPKQVALVSGHGEMEGVHIAAFEQSLSELYHVKRVSLRDPRLDNFQALVIAKPTCSFSEGDKYRLDQYIMRISFSITVSGSIPTLCKTGTLRGIPSSLERSPTEVRRCSFSSGLSFPSSTGLPVTP